MKKHRRMALLNRKGATHLFLSIIVALFFLIGVWYVYKSYENKQLKENMIEICKDYQRMIDNFVKDEKDKERIKELFSEIDSIVKKNTQKNPDK